MTTSCLDGDPYANWLLSARFQTRSRDVPHLGGRTQTYRPSVERQNRPPTNLTLHQGIAGLVDLVQLVARCYELVEVERALPVPVEELRIVALGTAAAAESADVAAREEDVPHVQRGRRLRNADEHRCTALP